jgi:dTMP kinase
MLVVIDGIDGAGKGTLTRHLLARADGDDVSVATLAFPRYEETAFGKLVGQYLDGHFGVIDEVPVRFAALLFAGDRYESREKLVELMSRHSLVILDRYVSSNIAYSAAKLPPDERAGMIDWIEELEYGIFALPKPDMTYLLTTGPATADELVTRKAPRSYTESSRDLHEADNDLMTRVAAIYRQLAEADDSWLAIDPVDENGELRPPETIAEEVWRDITARF